MKKLFIFFISVLLVACNQFSNQSIEDRATDQMKKTLKEFLNNPDGAKLQGVRTEYKSDSLCVLEFILKAKNANNQMVTQKMEYIYIDLDKMKDDDLSGQIEGVYYIGFPGSILYETEYICSEDVQKEFKEKGIDPKFVLSNTVFAVKDKYKDFLIKYANHSPSHPKIEDKLIFSASWLKVGIGGRDVNNDSKDIEL